MSGPLTIPIPERLAKIESQNQSTFGHWRRYQRYRDRWLVALRTRLIPRHTSPTFRVHVHIISRRARLLDEGNLIGGAKPIPDVLVRLKYLHDDSPRWCRVSYEQETAPAAQRGTTIIIEPDTGEE